jgi:bacteriorhodopsin
VTPMPSKQAWRCAAAAAALAAGTALLAASFRLSEATHEVRQRACNYPQPTAAELTEPAGTLWFAVAATVAMLAGLVLAYTARRGAGPRVAWLPPLLIIVAVLATLFAAYFGVYGALDGRTFTPDCIG